MKKSSDKIIKKNKKITLPKLVMKKNAKNWKFGLY